MLILFFNTILPPPLSRGTRHRGEGLMRGTLALKEREGRKKIEGVNIMFYQIKLLSSYELICSYMTIELK